MRRADSTTVATNTDVQDAPHSVSVYREIEIYSILSLSMDRRGMDKIKVKTEIIKLLKNGEKERDVMTQIMGRFGYAYSTTYAMVQECKALIKMGRDTPIYLTGQPQFKDESEDDLRQQWGNVKEVQED